MTFTDIQNEVLEDLNLTSAVATARVGRSINRYYKRACSGIGLESSTHSLVPITATTTISNQSLVFTGTNKLLSVFNPAFTPPMVLEELTFDEIRNQPLGTDPPQSYAIQLMGATTVTIWLSSIPATMYSLSADAELVIGTLSGVQVPAFDENFHDLLIYGAMAVELDKMEKYDLAEKQENLFESRLSALRMKIAISAYMDIYQGKTENSNTLQNPRV